METPGFCTLQLINVIVNAVVGALYSITENEAGCLGIFLNEIWSVVAEWRYDQNAYETQVAGKVRYSFICLGTVSQNLTPQNDTFAARRYLEQ